MLSSVLASFRPGVEPLTLSRFFCGVWITRYRTLGADCLSGEVAAPTAGLAESGIQRLDPIGNRHGNVRRPLWPSALGEVTCWHPVRPSGIGRGSEARGQAGLIRWAESPC